MSWSMNAEALQPLVDAALKSQHHQQHVKKAHLERVVGDRGYMHLCMVGWRHGSPEYGKDAFETKIVEIEMPSMSASLSSPREIQEQIYQRIKAAVEKYHNELRLPDYAAQAIADFREVIGNLDRGQITQAIEKASDAWVSLKAGYDPHSDGPPERRRPKHGIEELIIQFAMDVADEAYDAGVEEVALNDAGFYALVRSLEEHRQPGIHPPPRLLPGDIRLYGPHGPIHIGRARRDPLEVRLSSYPQLRDRAGNIERVQQLVNTGIISPERARELLEPPGSDR